MRKLKSQNRTLHRLIENTIFNILRILIIAAVIIFIWSQNNLVLTRNYIYSSQDLPKSFVGYKILHISDICNTNNNIISGAKKASPNVIVLSGGYEDANGKSDRTVRIVNELCNIAPVYYIYNTNDQTKCLDGTQAINITDSSDLLKPNITDVQTFIENVYGKKIINNANKGDEEALQYMQYISDSLADTSDCSIKICGIDNMNGVLPEDIKQKSYEITGDNSEIKTIMLNGNLANLDSLCETNIDIMFVGGTFGKSSETASCSKGPYSYLATQLFVSGGCGNYTNKRILNLPEMQLITLSDGTIKQLNPLESALDKIIGDVGTIYDNDGGFSEHTYTY